jgi:dTDP-4-dehydrorhamnose reductase
MTTVCVVGASGFIGSRIFRTLRASAPPSVVVSGTCFHGGAAPGVVRLDVTDAAALDALAARGHDLVVWAAGTKDVARCERDPEWARALNATPLERLARAVARAGSPTRIAYLSTDYVFDGERGGYRDDEHPSPRTEYGRSKALAERALLASGSRHKIVRSAAVMAPGGAFFDWLVASLRAPGEVRLLDDCCFSPTPAALLADGILGLLRDWDAIPGPVLHVVGERRMTRLELGCVVARLLGSAPARLVPAQRPPGGYFQRDLSLVPSDVTRAWRARSVEAYLAGEVAACAS